MMKNFVLILSLLIVGMFGVSAYAISDHPNLYVSRDIALDNIPKKIHPTVEPLGDEGGCNSEYPQPYKRTTSFRYIDRIAPTFNSGFFKNEFPIIIDATTFSSKQFQNPDSAIIHVNEPAQIKLLLFENTGPHNIQNVTVFSSFAGNDFQNDTFVDIVKNPYPKEDTTFHNYLLNLGGDILLANKYPNKLGSFNTTVSDPHDIFSTVTVAAAKSNHKMEVLLQFNFTEPIGVSNLGVIASDIDGNTMICNIIDSINVVENPKISN